MKGDNTMEGKFEKISKSIVENELFNESLNFLFMMRLRIGYRSASRKKHKIYKKAILSVVRTLRKFKKNEKSSIAYLLNVSLYMVFFSDDMLNIVDDFVYADNIRRKRYIAKIAALLAYESMDDLRILLGREIRNAIINLEISQELYENYEKTKKNLQQFNGKNGEYFKNYRNSIIGHRELNSLDYFDRLEAINPTEVIKKVNELIIIVNQLSSNFTEFLQISNDPRILIKELYKST
jgi:hypothetical protein